MYDELKIIFEKQRQLGQEIANKEFEQKIFNIAFRQRPIQSMKEMVGFCQFEQNEKRAPKAAYTSEIFVAVQKLVNTRFMDEFGVEYKFNAEQIKAILAQAHSSAKVTYKQAKKLLALSDKTTFNGLKYTFKPEQEETSTKKQKDPEDAVLVELKKYQEFKKLIIKNTSKEYFEKINDVKKLFNDIAEVLLYEKSDEAIKKEMDAKDIPNEIIEAVKDSSSAKVLHLSVKAMEKIIPYMLEGYRYNEACEMAGYDFKNEKDSKGLNYLPVLPEDELPVNPVVQRSISQTRKVVNAIIRKYGKPDRIIIETGRDLGKSGELRDKIKKEQADFQTQKEAARKRCLENGVNPDSKNNLLRFRLWEQQNGRCIYSQKPIDIRRLSEPNYTDIDHIIPYSKSFDDKLNNKVLCLSDENRNKGNKIPYEYLCGKKVDWYEYSEWVKSLNLPPAKTGRILKKSYDGNADTFISRNLSDTKYMAIFIKDYIKDSLDCKVETRNGSFTAFLRNQWGINKIREENDRHHAVDAAVLACSTQGMVKYLSTVTAKYENFDFINHSKPRFKQPWETFTQELEEAKEKIFVSRMPMSKISGGMHEGTFRCSKYVDEGYTTVKKSIKAIKLKDLENMHDKERNIKLYNVLKERLTEFGDDPKKAFAEPIFMPMAQDKIDAGQQPHIIRSIKIKDSSISGIQLPHGFANNDSMPRVDVFSKPNKKGKKEYYLIPIYVADFAGGKLPDRFITQGKNYENWTKLDDTFKFEFSLFKNTLISVNKSGTPEDTKFYYFKGVDIATGNISFIPHDSSLNRIRLGIKTMYSVKKYQVNVLGEYHEVRNEKRMGIKLKGNKKETS